MCLLSMCTSACICRSKLDRSPASHRLPRRIKTKEKNTVTEGAEKSGMSQQKTAIFLLHFFAIKKLHLWQRPRSKQWIARHDVPDSYGMKSERFQHTLDYMTNHRGQGQTKTKTKICIYHIPACAHKNHARIAVWSYYSCRHEGDGKKASPSRQKIIRQQQSTTLAIPATPIAHVTHPSRKVQILNTSRNCSSQSAFVPRPVLSTNFTHAASRSSKIFDLDIPIQLLY